MASARTMQECNRCSICSTRANSISLTMNRNNTHDLHTETATSPKLSERLRVVKIRQKNGEVLTLSVFCRDRLATLDRKW